MTGTDTDFIRWAATLGVGGVLAGMMFMFYRKDVRQYTALWEKTSGVLMEVVRENTAANTKLVGVVEALHRRLDRNHIDEGGGGTEGSHFRART